MEVTKSTDRKINTALVALRKAARRQNAGRIFLHGQRNYDSPTWTNEWTFTVSCQQYNKSTVKVDVPGYVSNGHTSEIEEYVYEGRKDVRYSGHYKPQNGFWSLFGSADQLTTALESIPDDAEIRFDVSLDGGTNQLMVRAGLHGDFLRLNAVWSRNGKRIERKFLIDTACSEHNSARFGT